MKFFLISLGLGVTVACTTPDGVVKEIDTSLDHKGQVGLSNVGVNKDGQAILQTETAADEELRHQKWQNKQLEDELSDHHFQLKRCREDLADPRLGGSGSMTQLPEIDNMKSPADVKEEIGLDKNDGSLKVVKREIYTQTLASERKYEQSLRGMLKTVQNYKDDCERKMRQARVEAGLPGERYKAQGRVSPNGSWIETRKGERTLDDAFEIRAQLQEESKR